MGNCEQNLFWSKDPTPLVEATQRVGEGWSALGQPAATGTERSVCPTTTADGASAPSLWSSASANFTLIRPPATGSLRGELVARSARYGPLTHLLRPHQPIPPHPTLIRDPRYITASTKIQPNQTSPSLSSPNAMQPSALGGYWNKCKLYYFNFLTSQSVIIWFLFDLNRFTNQHFRPASIIK